MGWACTGVSPPVAYELHGYVFNHVFMIRQTTGMNEPIDRRSRLATSIFVNDRRNGSYPEEQKDPNAGEADSRVAGPDLVDVLEDPNPRVHEPATGELK